MVLTAVRLAAFALVASGLVWSAVKLVRSQPVRRNYMMTLRAMRPWMVLGGVINLATVITLAIALGKIAPAFLTFGWWKFLGGNGNAILGQTTEAGIGWRITAVAVPLIVLPLIPIMAFEEEILFRQGSEELSMPKRLLRQIGFGLVHPLGAGIPITAGLALTISGFYFERVYLRTARPLALEIAVAGRAGQFTVLPHPEPPEDGDRDSGEWTLHREEKERIADENLRRFREWQEGQRDRAATDHTNAIRRSAVANAAAAHAVSNMLAVTSLLVAILVMT